VDGAAETGDAETGDEGSSATVTTLPSAAAPAPDTTDRPAD
jgi:hypothetical protein